MEHWSGLDWIAYGCLAISAFIGTVEGALAKARHLRRITPRFLKNPNWGFAPAVLVVTSTTLFYVQRSDVTRQPLAVPAARSPAATPSSPAPRQLSEDEKQLKEKTRDFVLTILTDQMTDFGNILYSVAHPHSQEKDNPPLVQAAGRLLDASVAAGYAQAFIKIKTDAQKNMDDLDLKEIGEDLRDYDQQYASAQSYLRSYLAVTGQSLDENAVEKWLNSDGKVVQSYSNLLSFPLAKESGLAVGINGAADYFRSYLKPKN